jgi:hypothetical protein
MPLPIIAIKTLTQAFGAGALGNPKTAEDMQKGFSGLARAVGGGLKEGIEKIKELATAMNVSAPALALLTANFQSETAEAQTELMISLMELAQSEGVKLGLDAIAAITNSVVKGVTSFTNFATDVATTVGKVITSSPYWKRVKDAFDALEKQSAQTLITALNSLLHSIEILASNPLVLKAVDTTFANLELALKSTTIALTAVDLILGKVEDRLDTLFPYLFPSVPDPLITDTGNIVGGGQINLPGNENIMTKNTGYGL